MRAHRKKLSSQKKDSFFVRVLQFSFVAGYGMIKEKGGLPMKRLAALFFALVICCVSIPAAALQDQVMLDDVTYTVDTEAGTISDEENFYLYQVTLRSDGYTLDITYPNGAEYSRTAFPGGYSEEYGEDYRSTPSAYPDGDTLEEVLQQADVVTVPQKQAQRGNKSVLLLLLLLVLGLFFAGYPYGAWYIEWGWHFKGAEPSPGALLFNRVIGILLLIGTLVWFIFI